MATLQAPVASASHRVHSSSSPKRRPLTIVLEPGEGDEEDSDLIKQQFLSTPTVDTMKELQVPQHPIPSMQGAFAESMLEASQNDTPELPKPETLDTATRRRILLDQDITQETHASKWKYRPGQRYHELWKLMSQISFGIYLLLNGIAKDDDQVLNLLQGHVDEVDAFLEMTVDDFDLAQMDIDERLKYLKTPLENVDIFDAMLEDRAFRLQIVTGNERIEHIITRTATAMNDSLKDVQKGLDATKEFATYLTEGQDSQKWQTERPEMQRVYDAMKGNAEGWYQAYVAIQEAGENLGVALVQLGSVVAEMDKRAGDVSRKTRFSVVPGTTPNSSSGDTSKASSTTSAKHKISKSHQAKASISQTSHRSHISHMSRSSLASLTKDLPGDPSRITPAIRASLVVFQNPTERGRSPEPPRLIDQEKATTPEQSPKVELRSNSPNSHDSDRNFTPEVDELEYNQILKEISKSEPRVYPALKAEPQESSEFTLQPRTYTPGPHLTAPEEQEKLEIDLKPRNSLRNRFSMKRKDLPEKKVTILERRSSAGLALKQSPENLQAIPAHQSLPSPGLTQPPQYFYSPREVKSYQNLRSPQNGRAATSQSQRPPPETQAASSADSRIPDSAYYSSDDRKGLSHVVSRDFLRTANRPTHRSPSNPPHHGYVSSPRSDQQHFHPVHANPNSPLQRPWTAAGAGPTNLRFYSPSTTNLSMMTDVTTVTEGGTKVKAKKKKGAFGWFKNAFALSEEEKLEFERKRAGGGSVIGNGHAYRPERGQGQDRGRAEAPRYLDGRRIR